jgi:hypothetical protein
MSFARTAPLPSMALALVASPGGSASVCSPTARTNHGGRGGFIVTHPLFLQPLMDSKLRRRLHGFAQLVHASVYHPLAWLVEMLLVAACVAMAAKVIFFSRCVPGCTPCLVGREKRERERERERESALPNTAGGYDAAKPPMNRVCCVC